MSSAGSVTHWIGRLKEGDSVAAEKLWERYFPRMVSLARQHLRTLPRQASDEEDVALSALGSFFRDAQRGRFPKLHGRDDLWPLLMTFTAQKALDLIRRERARKRGAKAPALSNEEALANVTGREPPPDMAEQLAEDLRCLLARLPDWQLQTIAVMRMEGYTNEEIAAELGCVTRTVERRLRIIRKAWA
jgi:RNA polymerase sigma factor (sigma-70 family)